jgi:hypothetical protein
MYEFILVNLYTKISEKKDLHPVGISTWDQYPRLKSSRSAIHHPAPSVSGHFFYRKLTKCGHLEDKTLAVVSLILSLF